MVRIWYRRRGSTQWLFWDCSDEADARRVRANLMAGGWEVQK